MSNVLYDTTHYVVEEFDNVIGEDGKYGAVGYVVVNKSTKVVEHTTMILPQAIYQAQGFSDSLETLLKSDDPTTPLALVEMPTEDVVPN